MTTHKLKYNYKISLKLIIDLSEQIFANIFHTLWRHNDVIRTTFGFLKPVHAKLQTIIFRMVVRWTLYLVYFSRSRLRKIVRNGVWKRYNSGVTGFMKEQYFWNCQMFFWKFKQMSTTICIVIRSILKLLLRKINAKVCRFRSNFPTLYDVIMTSSKWPFEF